MSKKLRLKAYLMRSGQFDKIYQAEQEIRKGNIFVDGKQIKNIDFQVKKNQEISYKINGIKKKLNLKEKTYLVLNKPRGCVCQKTDEEKSVYELIYKIPELDMETKKTLFCVGRLDRDTEGLLLVTNDGDLSNYLMKPEKHIQKTYFVQTLKKVSEKDLEELRKGILIMDDDTGDVDVAHATQSKLVSQNSVEITIDEGRKRQVKKMFEKIENKVVYLKRISIGNLRLDDLDFKGKYYLILKHEDLEGKFV